MKTPEEMAEAIENEAILYVSRKSHNDSEYYLGIDCFKAGYKAAAPQWISVKERLPELWNDYLAFGYSPTIPACCFVVVYDPKSNKWYDMHTDWDLSDFVICWQPVPEPPEEEK